jgi:hypothetical protein
MLLKAKTRRGSKPVSRPRLGGTPKPIVRGEGRCLEDLLTNKSYKLDYFQRNYVWTRDQVSRMVGDLTRKFLAQWDPRDAPEEVRFYDPYFLGPFVTYEKNGKRFLADGQQRFVSLILLLIHLRRLLLQREDDSMAMHVAPLIYGRRTGEATFAVDSPTYRPLFDALFNGRLFSADGEPPHIVRAADAYSCIEDMLPQIIQEEALPLFVDWLLRRVSLVEMGAGDVDRAWEIFQSMNDVNRGVNLTPMDHLKGYLIEDALGEQSLFEESWQAMVNSLEAIRPGSAFAFVKTVLRARFAPAAVLEGTDEGPSIERATHEWVRRHESLMHDGRHGSRAALIPSLFVPLSQIYRRLLRATRRLTKRLESVYYNQHNGIMEQFDLTIASIHPDDSEDSKTRKMQLVADVVDILLVRNAVNNRKCDQEAIDTFVAPLLVPMRSARTVDDVRSILALALASDGIGLGEVESLRLRDNGSVIHYILARMTGWLEAGAESGKSVDLYLAKEGGRRRFQIEHLLPNSRMFYASQFDDDDDYQHWRSRLGALVLIDGPENAAFGASPLDRKVDWYRNQNLLAASLSPDAKGRAFTRFRRFIREQNLQKVLVPYFKGASIKDLIEQRSRLYRQIVERLWSPASVGLATAPASSGIAGDQAQGKRRRRSYGVSMGDLLRAGLIVEGDILLGAHRSRTYRATVLADGRIRTLDGSPFDSPSAAAMDVLNRSSWNGWLFWRLERTGEGLDTLRAKLLPP